jgi:hypothetical protein
MSSDDVLLRCGWGSGIDDGADDEDGTSTR